MIRYRENEEMRNEGKYLFSEYDLRAVLEAQQKRMLSEIDAIPGERLLHEDPARLAAVLSEKVSVEAPQIDESRITVDHREAKIDVSGDFMRAIRDSSHPVYVNGTEIRFFVPFTGDAEAFKCRPSTSTLNPPRASVTGNELVLSYTRTEHNPEAVKAEFERDLGQIKSHLECIARDVAPHNAGLPDLARKRIDARRAKLEKDQSLVSDLGFPVRRRE